MRIDAGLRDKLDPRTRRCYFVGYLSTADGDDRKGWLFYDPAAKRFLEGVDVTWFEGVTLRDAKPEWLSREAEGLAEWEQQLDGVMEDVEGVVREDNTLPESVSPPKGSDVPPHDTLPHAPPLAPAPLSAPPPRPPKSTSRRSGRLARPGETPKHFVPLEGAPTARQATAQLSEEADFSFAAGLRCVAENRRANQPLLAGAALDIDLSDEDPDVSIAATLEIDESGSFQAFPVAASDPDSPSIKQALASEDRPAWIAAINVELEAFAQRGVWDEELVERPHDARAIPLKWVLLIKRDEHGNIIKYKARLVARGDLQREGIDYGEVFSSTIRFSTILTLLALATTERWDVRRFDVTAAFLHGHLDEKHPIYVKQVPGFELADRPHLVRRLRRSLYGLRQAGRKWNEKFVSKLQGLGFAQSKADPSLFVRRRNGKIAIVPIHVDDGLVLGDDDLGKVIEDLSASLDDSVKEEEPTLFLGVRIRRRQDGSIALDQRHYVEKIMDRFGFEGVTNRPLDTPASLTADLRPRDADEPRCAEKYRELLGALLYLAICTRPDISYAVSVASRFAADPAQRHWIQLKRILRYVASTKSDGLIYQPTGPRTLTGFTDSDHAADPHTRRSVSGWVFTLAGAAIDWQSKRQAVVSISSTEAEYYAFSSAVREAVWLRALMTDIGFPPSGPTLLRADNRSMILLADHPNSHQRTKHFAVHAAFSREKVASGEVQLEWLPTDEMPADMLTKALAGPKHRRFCSMVGLANCHIKGVCWRVLSEGSDLELARWREFGCEFGGDLAARVRTGQSLPSGNSLVTSRAGTQLFQDV